MQQDTYAAVPQAGTYQLNQTAGHVLCCLCGVSIAPNPTNMCVSCLRTQVDITEGVQKQVTVLWCKGCTRWLQPPKHWLAAAPESKELLTYCIKRVKGLSKVKLVDAAFVWTEPHSMRLKVRLTLQAEVLGGAILQQALVVEYVVERHMCPACSRAAANPNAWVACVQVRQHVAHKRTFMYLEQLILRAGADEACTAVKAAHEGLDFYFAARPHALRFLDFLQGAVPARHRADKQLVSHDIHTSSYNYKYTFSVEIAPLCKDDLACLPAPLSRSLGHLGPVVLVTRVTGGLALTDPATLRSATLDAGAYWRAPFRAVMSARQLTEYVVLDVEEVAPSGGARPAAGGGGGPAARWALAHATVARASDFGANDRTAVVRTHLGRLLRPGDRALGYDVASAVHAGAELEAAAAEAPDVVLVRKSYEESRRRRRARAGGAAARPWRLRRLAVEDDGGGEAGGRRRPVADPEADMERFLEELEEDPEMRSKVALWRDPQAVAAGAGGAAAAGGDAMADGSDDEGSVPEVPLEELLDGLAAMQLEEEGGDGEGEEEDQG